MDKLKKYNKNIGLTLLILSGIILFVLLNNYVQLKQTNLTANDSLVIIIEFILLTGLSIIMVILGLFFISKES